MKPSALHLGAKGIGIFFTPQFFLLDISKAVPHHHRWLTFGRDAISLRIVRTPYTTCINILGFTLQGS